MAPRDTAAAKLTRAGPLQALLLSQHFGTCDSDSRINFPNLSQRPCQRHRLFSAQPGFISVGKATEYSRSVTGKEGAPTELHTATRYSQTTATFWGRQMYIFSDISRANQVRKKKFDYRSLKLKMQHFSQIQLRASPNSKRFFFFFPPQISKLRLGD